MSLFDCAAPVLLADDDRDDLSLATEALKRAHVTRPLRCVGDGEKLLAYLHDCAASHAPNCLPALILLDLNMPRMGGREALGAIRADARLRHIPVVIWTTSADCEDVAAARAAGCDDYITKPDSFERMIEVMRALDLRWLVGSGNAE